MKDVCGNHSKNQWVENHNTKNSSLRQLHFTIDFSVFERDHGVSRQGPVL